jgi:hypothetical protein
MGQFAPVFSQFRSLASTEFYPTSLLQFSRSGEGQLLEMYWILAGVDSPFGKNRVGGVGTSAKNAEVLRHFLVKELPDCLAQDASF